MLAATVSHPFVLPRRRFRPAYLDTHASGELTRRVAQSRAALADCRLCPRDCRVDRSAGRIGVCRTGRRARVASAFPHFGEERCLSGSAGSGTIFFAYCSLRCVFCQNDDISWSGGGVPAEADEIAALMLDLQDRGCHNINFVTPGHVVPQILEALALAVARGLEIPLVYNTGAYDSLDSLALLDGVVDIYMPDFKFWDPAAAQRLTMAADYPETARRALRAMHTQVGDLVVDEEGIALRGVLVRHLVLPENLAGTAEVMHFLATELSPHTYVNVMAQYRPAARVLSQPRRYSRLARQVTARELSAAHAAARRAGLYRFDGPLAW